jgi:NAD(P)-dependent dehydrogenase (short-subunit alcohol dehydrogenase family)
MPPSAELIAECLKVLESLLEHREDLLEIDLKIRKRLLEAAGRLAQPDRTEQRYLARASRKKKRRDVKAADEALLSRAGIRKKRLEPVFITPDPNALTGAGGGVHEADVPTEPANLLPALGATQETSAVHETSGVHETQSVFATLAAAAELPDDGERLRDARVCYVCKQARDRVHFFYDQLCVECGDFNYAKRSQTANLEGRTALISGARVKIGYQAAILLLRAGARVIVTTRFPRDAARRYAAERDYEAWRHRLAIYGLDLRHTPSVEAFARHLGERESRLDFVLHNACQTVRRPAGFYGHLMEGELGALETSSVPESARVLLADHEALTAARKKLTNGSAPELPHAELVRAHAAAAVSMDERAPVGLSASAALSQLALLPEDGDKSELIFPRGELDQDQQQIDRRGINSWRLALDEVGTVELLEVQLVNSIAPFVLNARLKSLMLRERTFDKHIVNVSAMEGQFYRRFKTDKHPHTNMAKAALNMMTRTSAPDYAKDGIFMNSVDTGWVTDEDPAHIAARKTAENGFHPPLDIVDGAARIVDPIFDGINTGRHVWGQFLKDYRPTAW